MSERTPQVYAHLLTWFKTREVSGQWEMWNSNNAHQPHDPDTRRADGKRDVASVDDPLIGVYDSSDPSLIEYQLLTMRLCGVDGVVVDWDGRRLNPYRHEGLMALLPHLDAFGMKLIVCFEEWCGYHPPGTFANRTAEIDAARSEAQWLAENVMSLACYGVVRGMKPVLVFRKVPDQWFTADEWRTIRAPLDAANGAVIFPDDAGEALDAVGDGAFFWVGGFDETGQYGSVELAESRYTRFLDRWQNRSTGERTPLVFGSAAPGFDDTPVWGWGEGPRVAPREDGRRYEMMWQHAVERQADVVQLVTWNDWNEGTHLEASTSHGYRYLELTRQWAARFKNTPPPASDAALRLATSLYTARQTADRSAQHDLDDARDALLAGNCDRAAKLLTPHTQAIHARP